MSRIHEIPCQHPTGVIRKRIAAAVSRWTEPDAPADLISLLTAEVVTIMHEHGEELCTEFQTIIMRGTK